MSLTNTMMVFSACVNDTVHLLQYICYYLKLFMMGFGSSCDFLITTCIWWLSVYFKRYKTDFSTSVSWYINIISVNEITVNYRKT